MADANNPIPSSQSGDSEDVELALETAQRMYRTGDKAEALKWLRRAVNAADEAGNDMRQLQLARLAADLAAVVSAESQVVTSAPSIPPTAKSSPPPSPSVSRPPQAPSRNPPPAPPIRGSFSPGSAAKPSVAPLPTPIPQPPSSQSGAPPPIKSRPAPSSNASTGTSAAPDSLGSSARASESPVLAIPKPAAVPSVVTPRPAEASVSAAMPSAAPAAPSGTQAKVDKSNSAARTSAFADISSMRGAVRVSVRVSARDENLYIVRPLAEGQRLPPNAREARLVFEQDAPTSSKQS
jgi:hypothetical protein